MKHIRIITQESLLPEGDSDGRTFLRFKFENLFKDSNIVIISTELTQNDFSTFEKLFKDLEEIRVSAIPLHPTCTGDLGDMISLFDEVKREIPSIASIVIAGALGRAGELFLEKLIKFIKRKFKKDREIKIDRRKLHRSGYTYDSCNFYINTDLNCKTIHTAISSIDDTYKNREDSCHELKYDKKRSKWVEP